MEQGDWEHYKPPVGGHTEPVWGTTDSGPLKRVQERRLIYHGNRECYLEVLECGHQVIQGKSISPRRSRRCPSCHSDGNSISVRSMTRQ